MIHPDTEIRFVNEKIGVGIFATKMIPKGTIIWALDDLDIILEEDEIESLDIVRREIVYKYAYLNDDDRYVLCWDHARYMNHSFSPNVVSTVYEIEFASRDILPGEQITCDYASLGIDEPFECEPEEGTSSTVVMPDDYLHRYKEWDQLAREAFKRLNQVDQPLRHLIRPEFVDRVNAIAEGRAELDSFITLYEDE
ncbi:MULTISPECIES: SET domain-containing protein [Peribacillus]|uniref:SET domain-containing protein n=1 Tax=Peribacillus simplex TaxID=1478 RepID=A0A9W4KR91_9BACI|nr:SET domain-containing protein [Peribacillus simplex]WHX90449.1 SET domain-containing protein [Peribacillus simplex]CAH0158137.1 hypothetical protein SRABI133_00880 [Peribacillus simplex]